jgi:hypothetical protein
MREALSGKPDSGVQRVDHADTLQQKGRSPKRAPLLMRLWPKKQGYIFFSEHAFFAASHVPPAFSQSAAFFAVVTSPAKAGPLKASAKAKANVDTSVFMDVTPYGCSGVPGELQSNASCSGQTYFSYRRSYLDSQST